MIYLIKAGDCIKIGWSKDPIKRLKQIQTSNHHKCKIIATIRNVDKSHESKLHDRFIKYKTTGKNEWFRLSRLQVKKLKAEYKSDFRIHGSYLDFYSNTNTINKSTKAIAKDLIIPFGKYKGKSFFESFRGDFGGASSYWIWFLSRCDFSETESIFNKQLKYIIENDYTYNYIRQSVVTEKQNSDSK